MIAYFIGVFILTFAIIKIFFNLNPELGSIETYIGYGTGTQAILFIVSLVIFSIIYLFSNSIAGHFSSHGAEQWDLSFLYAGFLCIFIVAVIWVYILLFKPIGGTTTKESSVSIAESVGSILAVLVFLSLLYGIYKVRMTVSEKIGVMMEYKYVLAIIIYIVGVIVLYTTDYERKFVEKLSKHSEFIAKYFDSILSPILVLVGMVLFYLGSITAKNDKWKSISVFVCLIFFMISMYAINPNKIISTYFGPSLIATIILAAFGLLYIISLFSASPYLTETKLPGISPITTLYLQYGLFLSLFIFIITVTIGILTIPGGFQLNSTSSVLLLCLIVLVGILWIIALILSIFGSSEKIGIEIKQQLPAVLPKVGLIISGLGFSGAIIYWLVNIMQNLSGKNGIYYLIVNIIVALAFLTILYKIFKYEDFVKQNSIVTLIVDVFFYIPCIISDIFGLLRKQDYAQTTYIKLLFGIIIAYIIYFNYAPVYKKISDQGGKNILGNSVKLSAPTSLGSYQMLNDIPDDGTTVNNYNYGISCWIFLDSTNSHTVDSFLPILDYSGVPTLSYNPVSNTFQISVMAHDNIATVFVLSDFLLQKWNNIIINYSGGTLDVFNNGELVKTFTNISPNISYNSLTAGSANGLNGSICSVVYYKTAITSSQIYYIYNSLKNESPPIVKGVGYNFKQIFGK